MLNLKSLNDQALHEGLKDLRKTEEATLTKIIKHIAEVDRRRLFAKLGYPSLFSYLEIELSYYPALAQSRIDAARLLHQIPELEEKIEKGKINSAQISKFQQAARTLKKTTGEIIPVEVKREILNKIENQSVKSTELILAREFELPLETIEKKKIQSDESVRIEITFKKEELEQIEELKALLSNALPQASLKDLFLHLVKKQIKAKTETRNKSQDKNEPDHFNIEVTAQQKTKLELPSQNIPLPIRKFVLNRDQGCQFRDKLTGKICRSKYFLEIDHIQERHKGGDHCPQNLRILCSAHHKLRHQQENGPR